MHLVEKSESKVVANRKRKEREKKGNHTHPFPILNLAAAPTVVDYPIVTRTYSRTHAHKTCRQKASTVDGHELVECARWVQSFSVDLPPLPSLLLFFTT